jgi:hypothetical protein
MFSTIGSVFEFIDLSGKPVNLSYRKSESVKTALGGINSIIKIIFVIFICFTYVIPFWKKEKIVYLSYSLNEHKNENHTFDKDFLMAFSLLYKDDSDDFLPSDYIYFTASYEEEIRFK